MPDAGGTTSGERVREVEGHGAWAAASVALVLLSISYGSPLLIVVGLKPIAAALDTQRQVISLAAAMTWVGTGLGGILMGWLADRIGVRRTVIFGAVMIASGWRSAWVGRFVSIPGSWSR